MLIDAVISFFAAFGIFCLLQSLKNSILSPVPKAENISLSTIITVCGTAPELEATVKALVRQRECGKLCGDIVLLSRGMDRETALVAEKLARSGELKIIF